MENIENSSAPPDQVLIQKDTNNHTAESRPGALRRKMLKEFDSPRPLKISTIEKNYQIIKALAVRSEETKVGELCGKLERATVKDDVTASHVFSHDGQHILLSSKPGSTLLRDVYTFLTHNYNKRVRKSRWASDQSTQTDEQLRDSPDPKKMAETSSLKANDPKAELLSTITDLKQMSYDNVSVDTLTGAAASERLIEALKTNHHSLMIEALSVIINISALEHIDALQALIAAGVLPVLTNLLLFDEGKISSRSAWALANIAGGGGKGKSMVVSGGALKHVLTLIKQDSEKPLDGSLMKNVVWLLINMCRRGSLSTVCLSNQMVTDVLSQLKSVLWHKNEEIREDGFWILYYLLDPNNNKTMPIVSDPWVIHTCVEQFNIAATTSINLWPIVNCIGLISSVTHGFYISTLLESGLLRQPFHQLLRDTEREFPQLALLILGNICLCGPFGIDAIIESRIPLTVVECAIKLKEKPDIYQEIMILFHHFCKKSRVDQLMFFSTNRLHVLLMDGLGILKEDEIAIWRILNTLQILTDSGCIKPYDTIVTKDLGILHQLRGHSSEDIARCANRILKAVSFSSNLGR